MTQYPPQQRVLFLSLAFAMAAGPASAFAQFSGVVRDKDSLAPIPGVRVTVRALDIHTQTDTQGEFEISEAEIAGSNALDLTFATIGYYLAAQSVSLEADAGVLVATEILLEKVPESDGSLFEFPPDDACNRCHEPIYDDWKQSAMAKSGSNTWVLDIYNGEGTPDGHGGFVYTRDSAFKDSNPNSECAACHQPERWVGQPGIALGTDHNDPDIAHGISCSICHRIAEIDVTKTNFPGMHSDAVKMTLSKDAQPIIVQYGPLDDVSFSKPIAMRPSFQPQITSEVCAACHQDKNDPDEDGDFEEDNGVISEPTYGEWVNSTYGDPNSADFKSCANCHMKVDNSESACTEITPNPPRKRGELRKHTFEGSTPEFLENAVTLNIELSEQDGQLEVEVSIHNDRTGHHVPTGVTIRNMILLVEATQTANDSALEYSGDEVVEDLGGVGDVSEGNFAGLPGKLFAKRNHGPDGTGPVFFSEATGITLDNRIPAKQTDVSHYSFAAPADGGVVAVHARLIYRRSWKVLTDAKKWTKDGHGNALEDMQAPHFGHLMEEVSEDFTLTPPASTDVDAGASDRSDAGASGRIDAGSPNRADAETSDRIDAGSSQQPDAGSPAADTSDNGCGCATVGLSRSTQPSSFAFAFLAGALIIRRQTRRRRSAARQGRDNRKAVTDRACK